MLKRILSKLKREGKIALRGEIYDKLVYTNNHIDIIHDTCKICYDSKKEDTREKKLQYIERRVKTGHESILEHSNILLYFVLDETITNYHELVEVMELCKYLNIKTKIEDKRIYFVVGGSIRGYKHIFRNITNLDNTIAKLILNNLYLINKEYFTDFIDHKLMTEYQFRDLEHVYPALITNKIINQNISIINIDDINYIYNELEGVFELDELLELCSITILFEDISRIISQQVTRHRNAITQLSQRYVDYSKDKFKFNSPANFKPKYDKDHIYSICFNNQSNKLTLEELGFKLMEIYDQLVDKSLGEHRLVPEDARAYLPNNAQTSLYMTFTFKSLIKFLELRTDEHAQAEIRLLAETIESEVKPIFVEILKNNNIYDVLKPAYLKILNNPDLYNGIDEVIK